MLWYHILIAYIPALLLAIWFARIGANPAGSMIELGMVGMLLMLYLFVACVVTGALSAGDTRGLLLCAGLHFALVTGGCLVGTRGSPISLLYGLSAGTVSLAASGVTLLVRHLFG